MRNKQDSILFKASRRMFSLLPLEARKSFLKSIAAILNVDLLSSAYENIGVSKHQNFYLSGEEFLISEILPKLFTNRNITVFDVGANIGNYSIKFFKSNEQSRIFSFEPVYVTFDILREKTKGIKNITCENLGLGARNERMNIYNYKDRPSSTHASLYKEVISDLHDAKENYISFEIELRTLDEYCFNNGINTIDFLKIDTEGNEYSVLRGAENFLKERRIKAIQFEFGEMNIISKVFLKDFFSLLEDFNLYRLDTERLLPLFPYRSKNEIFAYQNLIAIRRDIDSLNFAI